MKASIVLFIAALVSMSAYADCFTYDGRQFCDTSVAAAPPVVVYTPQPPVVYYPPPVYYYPPAYTPPVYYGYGYSVRVDPVDVGIAVLAGAIANRIVWGGHHDRDDYHHHR